MDTYYSRGYYRNYDGRNNISRHYQQQPKVGSTQNTMKQIQQTQRRKNPCDKQHSVKISHMQKHLPYGSEFPREI